MKIFTRKRIWTAVVLIILAAAGYYGYSHLFALRQISVASGYEAKILCSALFVSGRDREQVLAEEFGFLPVFKMIRTKVDMSKRTVTASFMGTGKLSNKAVYHDKLGAVLLSGISEETVRNWAADIPDPKPDNPADVLWPSGDFNAERSLPLSADKKKLDAALDRVFSDPDPSNLQRTRAVVVVKDGRIVAERYAAGFTKNTPLLGWSMTKSVVNALIGILVRQGKLDISKPAPVPEWMKDGDPRAAITTDMLLRMSSGLAFSEEYEKKVSDVNFMLFCTPDMAAYAANKPLLFAPGTKWSYGTGTPNILSRIIRHIMNSPQEYYAFPRKELFNKLGMRSAVLEPDASGTFAGGSFMYASARDWARFGLLYLNDGVWDGERILPQNWVSYSTTPTPGAPQGEYGALFWLNKGRSDNPNLREYPGLPRDMYYLSGYQSQSTVIIPSLRLVIVRLGLTHQSHWTGFETLIRDVAAALGE